MSDVFRATDEVFGTEVAIKVVRSPDADYARRSALEAQALRRFQHPGLVQLLETGVSGDMTYLVMEFVDGESLATKIQRGRLTTGETADIGATLAGALAYVHAQGVVHRDVKPANILIDAQGHARLADFGIARLVDTSSVTLTGTMIGTATYMAPEQIEDHAVGPSADVWSLGIVLLESLTGNRVYVGTPSEVIARRLAGPVTLPEGLPVPWRLLFSGMLALEPGDRLSASDVQAMLSTPAFRAPWDPTSLTSDITTITPSPSRQRSSSADETKVRPPGVSVTSRQPTPNVVNVRRGWRALAIASVVIVAGAILAYALSANTHNPPPSTTTTSTTTSTTTTTTTLPSPNHALTAFINDVIAGQTAKLIGPQTGQALSSSAQQAVVDAGNGNANLAANDLQQVATSIATGVSSGYIAQANGVVLQRDLTTLAKALGLGAAATPSSTTTSTTTTFSGPGNGNGPGNGHGNGNGFGPGN